MSITIYIIIAIYAVLNIITFALFGIDKSRRNNDGDRISENVMFLIAMFGGALGATIGMHAFNNKLHHKNFYLGMPALLLFHVVLTLVILSFVL